MGRNESLKAFMGVGKNRRVEKECLSVLSVVVGWLLGIYVSSL